jgi:hypothetical protein
MEKSWQRRRAVTSQRKGPAVTSMNESKRRGFVAGSDSRGGSSLSRPLKQGAWRSREGREGVAAATTVGLNLEIKDAAD